MSCTGSSYLMLVAASQAIAPLACMPQPSSVCLGALHYVQHNGLSVMWLGVYQLHLRWDDSCGRSETWTTVQTRQAF